MTAPPILTRLARSQASALALGPRRLADLLEQEQLTAEIAGLLRVPPGEVEEIASSEHWTLEGLRQACATGWTPTHGRTQRTSLREIDATAAGISDGQSGGA